jgi:hypothetical protein
VRKFLEALCDFTDDKHIANFPLINFLKLYKEYIKKIPNNNKSIKELKSEFINNSFDYYKVLTDDDVWFFINYFSSQRNHNACFQLAERLLTRDLPYSYLLNPAREHETEKIVQKFEDQLGVNEKWKIYVDKLGVVPYKSDKESL